MITDYHAKYYAYDLTKAGGKGVDRIGQSLFNASVDLNPHQVEAALFALRSPLSKGWLSMIFSRFAEGKELLSDTGIQCTTIDDVEQCKLSMLLADMYKMPPYAVCIRIKPSGRPIPNGFAISHEYALFNKNSESVSISRMERNADQIARYRENDEKGHFFWEMLRKAGSNSFRENRPTMYYPIFWLESRNSFRIPKMEFNKLTQQYDILEKNAEGEIAIYPQKDDGSDGCWYFGLENIAEHIKDLKVEKQNNGMIFVYYKRRPNAGVQPTTFWEGAQYSATEHGTALLKSLFGEQEKFSYPKSIHAVVDCLKVSGVEDHSTILDYFAGSGTTGHATINLNRNDNGNRKYILVEMGEYFDPVTKPRIEKVVFSSDWKDGRPVTMAPEPKKKNSAKTLGLDLGKDSLGFALVEDGELTDSGVVQYSNPYNGISHCFKYMRLESYEDALSNVELPEDKSVERMVSLFGDEYLIKYMLALDTAGSVLNLAAFNAPFDYKLKVTEKNETKEVNADLMETFNYLIGLTVDKMYARKIFSATPDPAGEYDGAVKLTGNDNGEYIFRQIEGTLPSGERALIIWRNITDNLLESNAALDAYFQRYRINPADREFDVIFVNGDNNIANLKNTEETWKVRMIEPEFKSRMFEEK